MFIWDSANLEHIGRHGVSSDEAEQVITNDPIDLAHQVRNGEERTVSVGETMARRLLVVITTLRYNDIRVVTAFPANKAVRKQYSEQKDRTDGEDSRDP